MKILLIILVLIVSPVISFGQTASQDSLETRLQVVEDIEKIPILIELLKLTQQDRPQQALAYANRAENLLGMFPDVRQESDLYTQLGWTYYFLKDFEQALNVSNQAEELASSDNYPEGMARSKLLRGRIFRETGDYSQAISELEVAQIYANQTELPLLQSAILNESGTVYRRKGESSHAILYHLQALEIAKVAGDKTVLAATYNFLGINHDIMGNYDEALRYNLQSLEVQEELNNRRGMAGSMTNLGTVHQKIGQYEDAINFYENSLPIWEDLGLKNELATTINNMGAVQELLGNFENARIAYQRAYSIWSELGNLYSTSIALDNLGSIHMYLGDFERALSYKKETLDNQKTLGNKRGIATTLIDLGRVYMNLMQPDSALISAEEGLQIAAEIESWPVILSAHQTLSDIHEKNGNFEISLQHYKLFKAANDTLFNADSQTIIAELQEQYRTRYQQQQIELLERKKELQRTWVFMLSGGFFLLIMFSGLMINRYKLKERTHKAQEQLHLAEIEKVRLHADTVEARTKLLHSENQRKSEELDHARNLQLSMLPSVLPETEYATIAAHMITAAEVGGDYYDVDISDDGVLTFCIGDATGHGTKAGLLVTVMKSLFNLMSQEDSLMDVMHRCSAAIKKMRLPNLYMVLAIARLRGNILELIGGGMPPALIYRASTGRIEEIELKGMPLGSALNYPYLENRVFLEKGDVVLLMSDGFPELNSPDGKMMGYSRAADILEEIGKTNADTIINHFQDRAFEWIQSDRPNDDMTFLVLKMK